MNTLVPEVGRRHTFQVTGGRLGLIWGNGIYTQDSDLATAAVHAGLLRDGETGKVEIEFVTPLDAYTGSTRNGIVAGTYGKYHAAFHFPKGSVDPATWRTIEASVGRIYTLNVTGSLTGVVWGSGIYTRDSDPATAAVHAGLLRSGESGIVEVEFIEPPEAYATTHRNGVTSFAYGAFSQAFRFRIAGVHSLPDSAPLWSLDATPGSKHQYLVIGRTTGRVYGSDVYTQDSDLDTAAVHSGQLNNGEAGIVEIEFLEKPASFEASSRNGVSASAYAAAWSAFRFRRLAAARRRSVIARGNNDGLLWGTDVYTLDSDTGAAAVHEGLLKAGELGRLEIALVSTPKRFDGSIRHGVTSQPWDGTWLGGSFRISNVRVFDLMAYAGQAGKKLSLPITGVVSASVWGTDVYTLDSDVAAAAVHAGVVNPGETKTLEIEILAAPATLRASTRNGVSSGEWGRFDSGVFRFVP
jgi:hypothetical protein